MAISLKCQYGLRAMYELSVREHSDLVRLTDIAEAQKIPARFLENILNRLRQGGLVKSRRGKGGGFELARSTRDIQVGEIIRFFEGSVHPLGATSEVAGHTYCPGDFAFSQLWNDAEKSLAAIYDHKTLRDLIDEEEKTHAGAATSYYI